LSSDSSCPVGSQGEIDACIGVRGSRGTVITLCGETIRELSEQVHLRQLK